MRITRNGIASSSRETRSRRPSSGPGKNDTMKCMSGKSCTTPITTVYTTMVLDFVERPNGDAKLTETGQKSFSKKQKKRICPRISMP
jgi:hypothetical protein